MEVSKERRDERIVDSEIRLTHQQAILQTLNDEVVSQQQTLDRLTRIWRSCRGRCGPLPLGRALSWQARRINLYRRIAEKGGKDLLLFFTESSSATRVKSAVVKER